jgi:hypothetical protein
MNTKLTVLYEAPSLMIVEVKQEGIICQSIEDYNWNNPIEE